MKFQVAGSVVLLFSLSVVSQTGGSYDLKHSVISGGGGAASTGGTYSVGGTIGQAIAGTTSTGGTFSLTGGFRTPEPLAPTAAGVSVSGRVRTSAGAGIRGVLLILTSPEGVSRQEVTNTFGHFRFEGVAAGNTYTLQVAIRRHVFANPVHFLAVDDSISNLEFVAN